MMHVSLSCDKSIRMLYLSICVLFGSALGLRPLSLSLSLSLSLCVCSEYNSSSQPLVALRAKRDLQTGPATS